MARSLCYLTEENRVRREQLGGRRLRFSDDQRRRLPFRAKELSRSALAEVASIVTPETLLAWHRKLISGIATDDLDTWISEFAKQTIVGMDQVLCEVRNAHGLRCYPPDTTGSFVYQ